MASRPRRANRVDAIAGLTVESLARAKGLDAAFLRTTFGLADCEYACQPAVRIPYHDASGWHLFDKYRLGDGSARRSGRGSFGLYGLQRLLRPPAPRGVVLCEGESDVWAAATHGVMAIGVSGALAWKPEYAATLAGFRVYVWEEPDPAAQRFVCSVAPDLPEAMVVTGGSGIKDLCELHQREGDTLHRAWAARIVRAVPIGARVAAIHAAAPPGPAGRVARPTRTPRPLIASDDAFGREVEQARHRPIDEVLASIGISLHGRGVERMARCPMHGDGQEANPSMSVNVQKNVWRCHACGVGGDVIALVQRARGLDFRSAVRQVAS
jgi:hypothetical protein